MLYWLRCPKCGQIYQYIGEPYETEKCPNNCDHKGLFNDFIIKTQARKQPFKREKSTRDGL